MLEISIHLQVFNQFLSNLKNLELTKCFYIEQTVGGK